MLKLSSLLIAFLIVLQVAGRAQSAKEVVLPMPNSVKMTEGTLTLKKSVSIHEVGAEKVLNYLTPELKERFELQTKKKKSGAQLNLIVQQDADMDKEEYLLDITKKGITITGSDATGIFYGVQSLLQLMDAGKQEGEIVLASQEIKDKPRFSWRSYMLDESRYFFGEQEVYRLLDVMAELKMNVFHWHLTDDAGWRIEIKQYPKLTEIGSKRKDTEIGTWGSGKTSGVPHEGFYTQKQIKEILKYAKERHIKIIPEIEMPGHASASVAAYPWLSTKNEQIEVPVKFGKHYYTYDVIDPRVQEFLKNVVSEVIELFETDVIHIGGDEVRFDQWEVDADMIAHKKAKGYSSFMDIQIECTNMMSRFIEEKGCRMMGWNEILGKNLHVGEIKFSEASTKIAPNVVVQFWKGDLKELVSAAKQGYRLVNSLHTSTYLDYGHKNITLKKAYDFNPIPRGLDKAYHKNIIGSGCQMWTEWTPTVKDIERQTFPRLAAYAEIGWTNLDVKNYDNFVKRLKPIVKDWEAEGITVYPFEELK